MEPLREGFSGNNFDFQDISTKHLSDSGSEFSASLSSLFRQDSASFIDEDFGFERRTSRFVEATFRDSAGSKDDMAIPPTPRPSWSLSSEHQPTLRWLGSVDDSNVGNFAERRNEKSRDKRQSKRYILEKRNGKLVLSNKVASEKGFTNTTSPLAEKLEKSTANSAQNRAVGRRRASVQVLTGSTTLEMVDAKKGSKSPGARGRASSVSGRRRRVRSSSLGTDYFGGYDTGHGSSHVQITNQGDKSKSRPRNARSSSFGARKRRPRSASLTVYSGDYRRGPGVEIDDSINEQVSQSPSQKGRSSSLGGSRRRKGTSSSVDTGYLVDDGNHPSRPHHDVEVRAKRRLNKSADRQYGSDRHLKSRAGSKEEKPRRGSTPTLRDDYKRGVMDSSNPSQRSGHRRTRGMDRSNESGEREHNRALHRRRSHSEPRNDSHHRKRASTINKEASGKARKGYSRRRSHSLSPHGRGGQRQGSRDTLHRRTKKSDSPTTRDHTRTVDAELEGGSPDASLRESGRRQKKSSNSARRDHPHTGAEGAEGTSPDSSLRESGWRQKKGDNSAKRDHHTAGVGDAEGTPPEASLRGSRVRSPVTDKKNKEKHRNKEYGRKDEQRHRRQGQDKDKEKHSDDSKGKENHRQSERKTRPKLKRFRSKSTGHRPERRGSRRSSNGQTAEILGQKQESSHSKKEKSSRHEKQKKLLVAVLEGEEHKYGVTKAAEKPGGLPRRRRLSVPETCVSSIDDSHRGSRLSNQGPENQHKTAHIFPRRHKSSEEQESVKSHFKLQLSPSRSLSPFHGGKSSKLKETLKESFLRQHSKLKAEPKRGLRRHSSLGKIETGRRKSVASDSQSVKSSAKSAIQLSPSWMGFLELPFDDKDHEEESGKQMSQDRLSWYIQERLFARQVSDSDDDVEFDVTDNTQETITKTQLCELTAPRQLSYNLDHVDLTALQASQVQEVLSRTLQG